MTFPVRLRQGGGESKGGCLLRHTRTPSVFPMVSPCERATPHVPPCGKTFWDPVRTGLDVSSWKLQESCLPLVTLLLAPSLYPIQAHLQKLLESPQRATEGLSQAILGLGIRTYWGAHSGQDPPWQGRPTMWVGGTRTCPRSVQAPDAL